MMQILAGLVTWAFSGAMASILVGGGVTLVLATGLDYAINTFLSAAASAMGGMTGDVLNLSLLFGWGQAISVVGGAFLSRVALVAAANVIGINKGT